MPQRAVHVTDQPVLLILDHVDATEATVRNTGANPADCGASDVAFGSGFTVGAGAEERIPVEAGERVFAVCGAGLATDLDVAY